MHIIIYRSHSWHKAMRADEGENNWQLIYAKGCQGQWQIRTLQVDDQTVGVVASSQWNPYLLHHGRRFLNYTYIIRQCLTSCSKSMLRIRSASSITRNFRARKLKPFVFSRWSTKRPGVAEHQRNRTPRYTTMVPKYQGEQHCNRPDKLCLFLVV